MTGGTGTMTVFGSAGNDTITGGPGMLTAALGNGQDHIAFGAGSSVIYEGSGIDSYTIGSVGGTTTRQEAVAYYKPGQDSFSLKGGLSVASQAVTGGSLHVQLSDGTTLQFLGLSTVNAVAFRS